MFSLTAEYALRAVVHLMAESRADEPTGVLTVGQIARATRVPEGYLSKVLQQLTRAGLIHSQRGTGGGFRLARPATEISVYDVVQAVDPIRRIETCPLGLEAHGTSLCPLHRQLDEAAALLEARFKNVCITALVESAAALSEVKTHNSDAAAEICSFPLAAPH